MLWLFETRWFSLIYLWMGDQDSFYFSKSQIDLDLYWQRDTPLKTAMTFVCYLIEQNIQLHNQESLRAL